MPPSPYRIFTSTVGGVQRLSPSFIRITLTGPDLDGFVETGADQRIKLLIPLPGTGLTDVPFGAAQWYEAWRGLPTVRRNPLRTYTVREVRAPAGGPVEIDVDFALHPASAVTGPATVWATAAQIGEPMAIVGPQVGTGIGRAWQPAASLRRVLLAGDETAVPAIARILAELPADTVGDALLEVPGPQDRQLLSAPAGIGVRWLNRADRAYGAQLIDAVRATAAELSGTQLAAGHPLVAADPSAGDDEMLWDAPGEDAPRPAATTQVWIAAERGLVLELRRTLASLGLPRAACSYMGYWRRGHAES